MNPQNNKPQQVKKSSSNVLITGLFVSIGLICFLLIIVLSTRVYLLQEIKSDELKNQINVLQKQIADLQKPEEEKIPFTELLIDESENITENQDEFLVVKVSGEISWSVPIEISSLNIFKEIDGLSREGGAKYYKVGEFAGEYPKKGEVILVSAGFNGPAFYPGFYRFIKDSKTGRMIFLEKYSDELYDGDGFDRTEFSIDKDYIISSLEFPELFIGPNSRQVLTLHQGVNVIFDSENLKKVFTDKNLGDVYTTANYSSSNVDVFSRNGFYIKAKDGAVRVYSLKADFVAENNVPEITWNNGTKNTGGYTFTDVTGCGSSNYISVVSKNVINISNDLKAAGRNSMGDIIYEFKDVNHKVLKDYYEKIKDWSASDGISYEEFAKGHSLFFWIDPFDRLVKFESNKFVSPAECAKPVIYLYPEKASEISVKVEPKGGMSYSDPDYNNGWIVKSDSFSNLTDLSSGKSYPYLFWEGRGGIYEQPQKGFTVAKENVHNFLVEKLGKLGLNEKEIADFVEFWEPKMNEAPYYFVTFLGNREMNQIAPLDITPKPDTVIRVLMDFSPLNEKVDFEGFEIKTPERKGFTIVEWGGVLR
ncbi:MAG: hypothetical protein KAI67_05995 [Candidatus Pacebacteria bacterium]|nr:hypothetical protein [Candidatus Paceibacterota bacterium]